jgi:hypothetical protein
MNDEKVHPPISSMAFQKSCYYSGCSDFPKWGVSSETEQKNINGEPLTLYTCDGHQGELTVQLRDAGTRYSLFPVSGPHLVTPTEPGPISPTTTRRGFKSTPFNNLLANCACVMIGLVVTPFVLLYFGGKWIFGWRPSDADSGK